MIVTEQRARPLVDQIGTQGWSRPFSPASWRRAQKLSEQALVGALRCEPRSACSEAIRTLEGRHLVERTPFSGVRVVQLSLDDVEQLL